MTNQALASLRARLYGFNSDGDVAKLLGDDVLREILELGPETQLDMTAIEIVAWLRWYRSQALSGIAASAERESATRLFEIIYVSDPAAVPGALRSVLREKRAAKQEQIFGNSPFRQPALDVQELIRRSAEQFQRYHLTQNAALLDEAIGGFRKVLTALPPASILYPWVEVMLGNALQMLWQRSSSPQALEEAVARLRSGLRALPATHEQRPMAMAALAAMLMAKHVEHADPALLTEAKDLMDGAAAAAEPGTLMYDHIVKAREMMGSLYPASRDDGEELDRQIALVRRRLAETPPGHADRPDRLVELGAALAAKFEITRIADTLEESARLLREAADTLGADSPSFPGLCGMLGSVLCELGQREGDLAESDEGIALIRKALAVIGGGPGNPLAAAFHGSLAVALWQRYALSEAAELLPAAVAEGRRALEMVAADSPMHGKLMHNLGLALHDLYLRSGDHAALDESIDLAARAELTSAGNDTSHRLAMNSLALGFLLRYQRTGEVSARNDAISWARRALRITPEDHPERLTHLVTLAQALEGADASPADLQEAIDLLRGAAHSVALRQPDSDDFPYAANALASALLLRAERAPDLASVDEAIGWLRRATTISSPGPGMDRCMGRLGLALRRRFALTGDLGALAEALTAYRNAASSTSSPRQRVARSAELGHTAAALQDWPLALRGFEAAIAELPLVVSSHLARRDQEHELTSLSGLATDAAASALAAGLPERAAELLEQGRGVLLAQALEMSGDLDELAERQEPVATRLIAVRDQLDGLGRPDPRPGRSGVDPIEAGRRADLRRRLATEWEELVARVREPGSAGLRRPASFSDLAEMASQGPIVMLNVSAYRSDALLLTAAGLDLVPLGNRSDLLTEAHRRVAGLHQVMQATGAGPPTQVQVRLSLADTLGWLWDAVAEPVLARLGLLAETPAPSGSMTRIWWCASGPLAMLPLHAAGRDGVAVIDKVVCSYTPTLRALRHARSRPAALNPAAGLLVVAMSSTPGSSPLPNARTEMTWLADTFHATTLADAAATTNRVLSALPSHPLAHFACHALADLDNPSASRLMCYDHRTNPLTVAQLARQKLPDAQLAYLSACSTAQTGVRLADEAISIASAFQLAGYGQVIGTLWEVGDRASAALARHFYRILGGQAPSERSAAHALHEAVQAVRRDKPTELAWAPYVHVGA